jgi:hypothetical protein
LDKRKSLGLIYLYNEKWIAGTYYILNIIKVLNTLQESSKPFLNIIVKRGTDINSIIEINYPYLDFIWISDIKKSFIKTFLNKFFIKIFNSYYFDFRYEVFKKVSVIFPYNDLYHGVSKKIFWIPDFQDWYLPNFFSNYDLSFRRNQQQKISSKGSYVVFSSFSALNDFDFLYPYSKVKKFVFNFSTIDKFNEELDWNLVLKKYNLLNESYFFCPNQFWQHKNHITILKTLVQLREAGYTNFKIYFSGKTYDHRNTNYFNELVDFIKDNNLNDNVKILGFIDRTEQILFLKNSIAVIQPSLFEGWSTVIEEAKALNKIVIASNIGVHKEQLKNNGFYFNPQDTNGLLNEMKRVLIESPINAFYDYDKQIEKSAHQFLDILNYVYKN